MTPKHSNHQTHLRLLYTTLVYFILYIIHNIKSIFSHKYNNHLTVDDLQPRDQQNLDRPISGDYDHTIVPPILLHQG